MQHFKIPLRVAFDGPTLGLDMVESGGFDSFSKPLGLSEHLHTGYEITYVFEGRVVWQLESGRLLVLQGGEMAITLPNVPHKGYLNIIQPASIFWIVFNCSGPRVTQGSVFSTRDTRRLDRLFASAGNTIGTADRNTRSTLEAIHDKLVALTCAGKKPDNVRWAEIRALICSVLANAALSFRRHSAREIDTYTAAAIEFMREHLNEDIGVCDICKRLGISAGRFHTIFKEHTGTSPNDYLQRLRVDTACALLASSKKSITTIALDLGFATSQYFAMCFKRYLGLTPRDYRNKLENA